MFGGGRRPAWPTSSSATGASSGTEKEKDTDLALQLEDIDGRTNKKSIQTSRSRAERIGRLKISGIAWNSAEIWGWKDKDRDVLFLLRPGTEKGKDTDLALQREAIDGRTNRKSIQTLRSRAERIGRVKISGIA